MFHVTDASRFDHAAATTLSKAVVPLFQPIYALGQGRIVGFEALARLAQGNVLLQPSRFLPSLKAGGLLQLFRAMLTKSIAFLQQLDPQGPLYVSVNVNASLVRQDTFVDLVSFILDAHGLRPSRLVLEILESEAIDSVELMATSIHRLRSLGVGVALDDVGSAYASLAHVKDLPVDIVKLDQSFSRLLSSRPRDIHFVTSMVGLARRLGRTLVVEGAETPEIVDALRMAGVAYAQGYALARPMPASAVLPWMATSEIRPAARGPCTLLGAYAAHLAVVEACHTLADQRRLMRWREGADDPHRCGVGRYLDENGLHDTALGEAHKRFHSELGADQVPGRAGKAAADFEQALLVALGAPEIGATTHRQSIEINGTVRAAASDRGDTVGGSA